MRPTVLLFAAALFIVSCRTAAAQEVIRQFDSVVHVTKDGTLAVTETIRVHAEGRAIKRGIFRDFPLTFTDAARRLHEVTFTLKDVTRDGKPEPHFTRRQGGVMRIYAGKEDVLLRRGDYTYVLRYETGRQVRWFDGAPEINWNVTGNFWTFPILSATYRLKLPDGARPIRWTAFTGRLGDRGIDWRGAIEADGTLAVATTRTLRAGEGFTVVAEIPEGAIERPAGATLLWYAFLDYRGWFLAAFGFGLVLIYYFAAWNAVGRDPKGGIVIPLFHAPKGMSPALANYVHNWGFSRDKWRAFTAAALSLAVRGLLKFDDDGGALRLKATGREPAAGSTLPAGERAILTWVKDHDGDISIDRANGTAVAAVADKFTRAIEGENKQKFFRRNLGYVVAGVALTVVAILLTALFGGLRERDIFTLVMMGFGGVWVGAFLVPVLNALFSAVSSHSLIRAALTVIVIVILGSIFANFISSMTHGGFSDVAPFVMSVVMDNPFPFALVTSFAALNGLFFYLMRAPTALGRPVMDQLAGFKLYLETAESDRLNLQAPELTAERFEELLPYAVALDVEKPWADAFASALSRAHPGDADPMLSYQPAWHSGGRWSSTDFSSSVASTVSSASSAFASAVPPSSSGSSGFSSGGGGGGSGGGGGGGGGGGW